MSALVIKKLHKTYRNGFEALKGIDLKVDEGDFFALLGPNGAGKSTAISIIASLINKSAGEVVIYGYDLDKEKDQAKYLIGLVPQEFNFNMWEPVVVMAGGSSVCTHIRIKRSTSLVTIV
ncbi:MAG: hypothetical protein DBP01_05680 [gamma proteobacterium symbiont of Ctena orbiculata]|nr:MAG: hypothetical protein DBP01_05680 [gamma proteobacterium symbiont of Ctena orbiculata]